MRAMPTAVAPRLPDDGASVAVPLTRDELAALLWGLDRLVEDDRVRLVGLRRRVAAVLADLTPTGAREPSPGPS